MHIKIPADRIGALVGPSGSVKAMLEEKTGAILDIDSETGAVEVTAGEDPVMAMRLSEVVRAIGRGFSPERAFPLLEDELLMLDVIDLSRAFNTKSDMARIKGRIIGKDGRTREITEKLTGVGISVYGKTIGVIGNPDQIRIARTAIEMLIDGAPHGAVYGYLEKKNQELVRSSIGDL
ncbi:MAG: Ribonuclease Y [Methanosaeta sp. PtaU1.Bin055]|jgi:ribosomal RNA assembly protein|nr:MAG: Ribonuclease Y [Methanosaeta sp. PtaU1.Bin055]